MSTSPARSPSPPSGANAEQTALTFAPVTRRAVLLGLLGAVQVAVIQVSTKVKPSIIVPPYTSGPYLSWYAIFPGAVFWIFLLAILNAILKRRAPHLAFRPAEFGLIFGITTVAAAIAAMDEAMQVFPMYMYPFRTSQDGTMGPFRQFIPKWFIPQTPDQVEPYYAGNTSFWMWERLTAWAVPIACWMTYITALGATMWAWNVLLRRRWMDNDRLSFPSVQLPMEMCRAAGFGGPLAGKVFWGGFLTAAIIESLSHLHQQFPLVPDVPTNIALNPLLDAAPPPWNALSPMEPMLSALHIGICYFIPVDILFSASFFYLFRKGLEVFGRGMGWRDLGWDAAGFPYARSQAAGAWAALFFLLVWAERHHLRAALRAAFSRHPAHLDDANEPATYAWAGRVLVGGTLFLIGFSVIGGMSLGVALVFYAFFWMLNVTMTRVYCQVGPPTFELYFLDPQKTLTTIFGTTLLSPASATHLSLLYWLNRTGSGHPMAHQMAAFYVGKQTGTSPRPLGRWVLAAFFVGALACLLACLHYVYRVGEDQWREAGWREGGELTAVARITQWVASPKGPQWHEIAFILLGSGVTLALSKASLTLSGFPFHPVGFALAMCYGVEYSWPAFLLMWLFKSLTLRYGGLAQYQRFVPFFLGVTLGGLITPVIWGFVAWIFQWYR